jgi:hypothetical protein
VGKMSYIKGFEKELLLPDVKVEPIIFDNPDGTYEYVGWNILLGNTLDTITGEYSIQTDNDTYTFKNVSTVWKGANKILLHASNLQVNTKCRT